MTPDQWRLAEDLFHQAQELPSGERSAWLDEHASADPMVRGELDAMLRAMDTGPPPGALEEVIFGQMHELMRTNKREINAQIGSRIGAYRLSKVLGQGGMGSVFEAVRADQEFDQRVAIKIIKHGLVRESAFLKRFKLERQILAKLEHPGIARLIDGGHTADGIPYFVMEFVNGHHLLEYCERNGLGLTERLNLVQRVCETVEYAHSLGIIHRDIKPSNILVTDMGHPKLLDFGIAKMQHLEPGEMTDDTALTIAGVRPFTPHYASPEQIRAETLTPASDVYSLGAVLYELLTGERPHRFTTMTQEAIENAVCKTEAVKPSVAIRQTGRSTGWRSNISQDLDNIVLTALRKDPQRRYATAGEFAADIGRFLDGRPVLARGESTLFRITSRLRRNPAVWALGAVAGLALAALAWTLLSRDPHVTFDFQQITSSPGEEIHPSLLPDGSGVVYASRTATGRSNLFLERFPNSAPVRLSDSSQDDSQPAVSPDGKRVAFRSERDGGGLFLLTLANYASAPEKISATGFDPAWSPDGKRIVYATEGIRTPDTRSQMNSHLWILDVDARTPATRVEAVDDGVQPSWSPDSKRLVYWTTTGGRRDIFTIDANRREKPVRVTDDAFIDWSPAWSPDGKYIYFSSDRAGSMNLWRVRVSSSGAPQRPPQPVSAPGSYQGEIHFAANSAKFAYVQRSVTSTLYETPLDNPSPRFLRERANNPDVSPDGRFIVYQDTAGKQEDLFIMGVDGQESRRLTNDVFRDRHPRWSPDGKKILFYSNRAGRYDLWTIDAASGALEQLTHTKGPSVLYGAWSPDGKQVLYNDLGSNPPYLMANPQPQMLPFFEGDKSYSITGWSPNGRWLAGFGRNIGVIAYELQTKRFVKLAPQGRDPVWFPGSNTVAYTTSSEIHTVTLDGKSRRILDATPNEIGRQISLSADGKKLYYTVVVAAADIWIGTPE